MIINEKTSEEKVNDQHNAIIDQCIKFKCVKCTHFFNGDEDKQDYCSCVFEGICIEKDDNGYKYVCENYDPIDKESPTFQVTVIHKGIPKKFYCDKIETGFSPFVEGPIIIISKDCNSLFECKNSEIDKIYFKFD